MKNIFKKVSFLIFVLTILGVGLFTHKAEASFAGGSGTEGDPWQIATCEQLQYIDSDTNFLNDYFILTQDIDCSETSTWNPDGDNPGQYFGFDPIASSTTYFTGSFNGNGKQISELYIRLTSHNSRAGLFERTDTGATIFDLRLTNVDVTNYATSASISSAGGLIGFAYRDIEIDSVSSSGNVRSNRAGGLIGYASSGLQTIENSYSEATITIDYAGGGLIGTISGSAGSIINLSYATGDIVSRPGENMMLPPLVGGLVGAVSYTDITNSYASGDIDIANLGGTYYLSQLMGGEYVEKYSHHFPLDYGEQTFEFTPENNQVTLKIEQRNVDFAHIEQLELTACGQVITPKYAKDLNTNQSIMEDILYNDMNVAVAHKRQIGISWDIPESCSETVSLYMNANEYMGTIPFSFKESYTTGEPVEYSPFWVTGTGHPDAYTYIDISDDEENIYFDIDITGDNSNETGEDWISITIDGKRFRVDDFDNTYGECPFGETDRVSYRHQQCNIVIPKSEINSDSFDFHLEYYGTGGAPYQGIGGLVGFSLYSTMSDSYATGNVSAPEFNYVGGLIGLIGDAARDITNVYASGNVSGNDYVGGLIGYVAAYFPSIRLLANSFSVGTVTGNSPTYLGGFIGNHGDNFASYKFTLDNNGWLSTVADDPIGSNSSETLTYNITDATVLYDSSYGIYDGNWDFDTIWTENNDTYPTLQNMPEYIVSYTITASAGANGSISPDGETVVVEGEDQTYTVTPDTGYIIDQITVDDVVIGSTESTYTFSNVSEEHTISVTFTLEPEPEAPAIRRSGRSGQRVQRPAVFTQTTTPTIPTTPSTPTTPSPSAFTQDLYFGLTNSDVTNLQLLLISKGYSIPAGATGFFGNQTRQALIQYQINNNITPAVGYFGPITRGMIQN